MVLKFSTRKLAQEYSKVLKSKQKQFGLVCKPKIVERKKYKHFVVIERCKLRKKI